MKNLTQEIRGNDPRDASAAKVEMKFELVVIPVSDGDRAKEFYARLGWRLDADFPGDDFRVVQFTPPGSGGSIIFGKNHWSGWYAAYIAARENGRTPDEAAKDAALHIEGARDRASA